MKKNKGFTLIELLAVIVVLAIIALIATPIVLNIINKAKEGAAEQSAVSYLKSVESSFMTNFLKNEDVKYKNVYYQVNENIFDDIDEYNQDNYLDDFVNISGSRPDKGYVYFDEKGSIKESTFIINNYIIDCDYFKCRAVGRDDSTKIRVENIVFSEGDSFAVGNGTTYSFVASLYPQNSTVKRIRYSISDPSIATVDHDGNITAHNVGTTTLTLKSDGVVKTITLNVKLMYDFYEVAKIGDYVTYVPSSTSSDVDTELTGCSKMNPCDQTTINPSKLNKWRVLRKYDGKVELVSENVTDESITVYGDTGYMNYAGLLNTIAKMYENEKYTESGASRSFGYSTQVEFYDSLPSANDTLYTVDENLLKAANISLAATNSRGELSNYLIPSRWFQKSDVGIGYGYDYRVRYVATDGTIKNQRLRYSNYNGTSNASISYPIRPIVVIKSGIQAYSNNNEQTSWTLN